MWRFIPLEIAGDGFSIILFISKPWDHPWILFGVFKYENSSYRNEPEWTLSLVGYYINIKWLWHELKKKRFIL